MISLTHGTTIGIRDFFDPFQNRVGAELFEVNSFVGMLPAASVTAVSLTASTNIPNSYVNYKNAYEN